MSIIWVPGHLCIHGNERAELPPPIAESVFKRYTKERAASKPEERSGITQRMARKTILFDKSKEKFLPTSDPIQLTQSQAHGPFRDHLALILLFDEPSCPKCGTNNDSNIHFTFDCIYYRKIRKKSLNIESKQQNTQNQLSITVTD